MFPYLTWFVGVEVITVAFLSLSGAGDWALIVGYSIKKSSSDETGKDNHLSGCINHNTETPGTWKIEAISLLQKTIIAQRLDLNIQK